MNTTIDERKEKMEILVVEDSPTQAERLKYILEKEDFNVTIAEDGEKALSFLSGYKPIIVISDIMMPGMNGYELCKRIKSNEDTREIPVILLTSLTSSEDVLEGLACGADNFITKPYSEEYLLSIISKIIANGKLQKTERVRFGVEIIISGKKRFVTADQQQMIGLLISTYEAAVQRNAELTRTQEQLRAINEHLEELVAERTDELRNEVNERKRGEEREKHLNSILRAIRGVNQLITKEKDRERLIREACSILASSRDFNSVWIALTVKDGAFQTLAGSGTNTDYLFLVESMKQGIWPQCIERVIGGEDLVIIEDVSSVCKECPISGKYLKQGILAARLEQNGINYGFIVISLSGDIVADKEEQGLFREVVGDVSFALYNLELEEKRIKMEKDLKTTQEQLWQAQKMEAIGRLSGGIAHDFNNVLTTIIGNAEMALATVKEEDSLKEQIEDIKLAGEKAATLTRQLLAFSRRQILQTEIFNLNEVVREMDKMMRRLIGEDIELETILSPDLGMVETDPGQVEQIILNLAVNARDAMPHGGKLTIESANVELDAEYASSHYPVIPGEYVMLSVSDTGIGMTKEIQNQIFEPFFTTKEKGKGTGLGLSIVYGIVKQSKGYIWVYSEQGQGTTFKIYLPRVNKSDSPKRKEKIRDESSRASETILVVEDDPMIIKMINKSLSSCGYKVLCASDGKEALHISNDYKDEIHLLFTDVIMPIMGGRVLAERLKNTRPGMKVLYMSGYTDNAIVHHGVLEKGLSFLQKPFTPKALMKKVREALEQG